jgi:TMEM175 potassium channel family protein
VSRVKPDRMNAFTDGVIAILITILVLELRPPSGHRFAELGHEKGKLLAYVLTFVFVAIYWNNHHHLLHVVERVDGRALWANIHLLFWLSLTPVATAWLGDAGVRTGPVAAYAIVLIGCAIAYTLLTLALLALHESGSQLARAIGRDRKGKLSIVIYLAALGCAFILPWVSVGLFVSVALLWFVPDTRIERVLAAEQG